MRLHLRELALYTRIATDKYKLPTLFACEMTLRIVPYRVEYEGLAEKHLDLVVTPLLRWQRLEEHYDSLTTSKNL
jgi:hypothetical protein